ncbi:hypothetical protein HQ708_06985 [Enterococcus faecium]|nr:hypothetical protein [Enterococcus faecium]
MGEANDKIIELIEEADSYPSSGPIVCFHNFDLEKLDGEIGFQIAESIVGKGEVNYFVIKDDCLIQRNFSMNKGGDSILLQATLKGGSYKEFFTQTKIGNDLTFNSYSLEYVKAAKTKLSRKKMKLIYFK